jgi:hypothetical protein
MHAILRALKSDKPAVALLLGIAVLSAGSTFFDAPGFFASPIFLVPVGLFALNLIVCAASGVSRLVRGNAPRRFGPLLVHTALLALIAGGILSASFRREEVFVMAEGESVRVAPAYTVSLVSFVFDRYGDGRPRSWVSTVEATRDGGAAEPAREIKVNAPLRLPGVSLYQVAYTAEGTVVLRDSLGAVHELAIGDGFTVEDTEWRFASVEEDPKTGWGAVFTETRGGVRAAPQAVRAGDSIGPLAVPEVRGRYLTGLKAVRDPGLSVIIPAFVLLATGLALSALRTRRKQ